VTDVSGNDLTAGCDPSATADSTGRCNTLDLPAAGGVWRMKQRPRIYYSDSQKALMWERWK